MLDPLKPIEDRILALLMRLEGKELLAFEDAREILKLAIKNPSNKFKEPLEKIIKLVDMALLGLAFGAYRASLDLLYVKGRGHAIPRRL